MYASSERELVACPKLRGRGARGSQIFEPRLYEEPNIDLVPHAYA